MVNYSNVTSYGESVILVWRHDLAAIHSRIEELRLETDPDIEMIRALNERAEIIQEKIKEIESETGEAVS